MEDKTIQQSNTLDMSEFVGQLQREDRRNMLLSSNMQWGVLILAIFHAVFFIVIPFYENTLYKAIGWSLYVLTFLSFGFIFNYLKQEYRRVDYGLPTLIMLKKAAKRYKFFQRKTTLATMPVLLVDVGMVLITFNPGQPGSLLRTILITQALFIPAIGIGLFIGNMIWRKRQKPLRDAALKMINELEEV